MPTIYLTELDTVLAKAGDSFKITSKNVKSTVPILKIDSVIVFGGAIITNSAIAELLERQIPVTFLSNNGKYYGRLDSTETKNVELRVLQYEILKNESFKAKVSQEFIKGKILNSVYLLKNLNRYRKFEEIKEQINKMNNCLNSLKAKDNIESIRGCEGSASAFYFQSLPSLLKENFGFDSRNRRPPKDPVNSLLSFTYTLLLYTVYSAVSIVGLDAGLGFLHEYTNNRPALPLDLMEEFRSLLADQVVIDLINHSMVSFSDFYQDEKGKYPFLMNNDLRKKLIQRFEKRLNTVVLYEAEQISYRRVIEYQARKLAKAIKNNDPNIYKSFIQQ